jgi:hypothetical protein
MCGIFGYSLRPNRFDRGRLRVLCAALSCEMDHRGGHSWGYYASEGLVRGLGSLSGHVSARDLASHDSLMAHTRMATTGKVAVENCHPFIQGSVVGAHNGIVNNHEQLNGKYKRDLPVDSQHIFQHMEEDLPLDDIEAYGAVEMTLRSQPGRIYLGTFNGGSLSVWRGKWGAVWASTYWTVKRGLRLASLKAKELVIFDDEWYYAEAGGVYTLHDKIGISPPPKKAVFQPGWYSHNPLAKDDLAAFDHAMAADLDDIDRAWNGEGGYHS